jgi:hypothetical protein
LYDSRPTGTNGAYPTIQITSANGLNYIVNNNGQISGGSVGANQWYHCAVARKSSVTKMFLDGVQVGADYADVNNYLNGASRPLIGTDGITPNGSPLPGFMDEIKVTKGVAKYVQNFTPPTAAYSAAGSGDVLWIVRAMYNTTADTHKANDRVQICLEYIGQDVANLVYDLLVTYANVDPSFITLANWQSETATYLNTVYSALIAEPTAVSDLVSELIEQASLVVWWDDVNEQIRLQVLRSIPTTSDFYDEDNMMMGTLQVQEQPDKRVSQVYTYFAKINPLVNADQIDNYASTVFSTDAAAELAYGSASIKKIFSRWIPTGGRAVATALNTITLARFVTPPRLVVFDVLRGSEAAPQLGLGYQIQGWPFQLQDGSPDTVPVQVVRLNPRADYFEVEAEEVFAGAQVAGTSPDRHTILIDANILNVNMRTIHDTLYAAPTSGVTVDCTVLAGIIVGSASPATPAFDVGSWPAGVTINLTVIGRIEGTGGNGGTGGNAHGGGFAASVGGTALFTRQAISLTDSAGQIWGGGGGGGGGAGGASGAGGGGGGGAGSSPGSGGSGGTPSGVVGQSGTTEAAGPGGGGSADGQTGGAGGGPGLAGTNGVSSGAGSGGAGAAAGKAVDGVSFITTVGAAGDRRGSQVN